MKPWTPPRKAPVLRFGSRRWTEIAAYWRETAHCRRMPAGATAGLSLVAIACLCVGILSYQAFGPRDVIAKEAMTQVAHLQS